MKKFLKKKKNCRVRAEVKVSTNSDTDLRHDRIKNRAMIDYYMLSGY
ncbi:hypothetical protein [Halanaerobium hydrogeniformans]|nr:hypothetical protein [Halanaerobium hydrogeniformans]